MASLVFCADGTWNHPQHSDEDNEHHENNTNVRRIFNALVNDESQKSFYDTGVGADDSPLEHLTGGAFGAGLLGKIKDGYRRIAREHRAGDRIHLFGFSRGAYTARSLAGMLAACGLPENTDQLPDAVEEAFRAYREKGQRAHLLDAFDRTYGRKEADVATIGVWDTVGSLGIPIELFEGLDNAEYGFLDCSLHPGVEAAFHALSIDEQRPEFQPTLWQQTSRPGQRLEQVWFPGVHSDVGGGYPDNELSSIPLLWMMRRAEEQGLRFKNGAGSDALHVTTANVDGTIHDSWRLWFGERECRTIPDDAVFASTVVMLHARNQNYRPENLPLDFPSGLVASRFADIKLDVPNDSA